MDTISSFMNYHENDYVIVSTIDFTQIKDQLVEAGLIEQDQIATILNSSKNTIKQNITLLKILFETRQDFTPFIEILRNDTSSAKHRKLAKQISAPEMLVREEKIKQSNIEKQNNIRSLSTISNNDLITNLFKELSFHPKSNESQESKEDTESGIYSEGDLNPATETISEEENNLITYTDSSENSEIECDDDITTQRIQEMNCLSEYPTLQEDTEGYISPDTCEIMVSNKMKRFKHVMLFSSMFIFGLIVSQVIIQQPSLWIRSLLLFNIL